MSISLNFDYVKPRLVLLQINLNYITRGSLPNDAKNVWQLYVCQIYIKQECQCIEVATQGFVKEEKLCFFPFFGWL